ncbi:hypothetical protein M8C21_008602 [Ambrosia artemisiifolia]|uniref:Uncharacterized protein n=1 Tax=Ambrosia artemisiifolia TaxID=4212 RepID=A0AAD5BMP9_AMBAR|nr:hypothetical protein M8C21_008602 [Ambrosia artemisiifolia]
MEQWRRKGYKCNQEFARTKSNYYYRKPPVVGGNPNSHPNVPYWEKRFVSSVGSFPWKKFLEAKKFTYLYDNIMKWNDCAGEEAFHTAKDRFYAEFHGIPCDEQFHNPDLYNDKIDWNAEPDHNLIQDLESEPVTPDDASPHEPVVIFEDVLPDPYKDYSPYGWGDSDDKNKNSWGMSDDVKRDENAINWDDYIDNGKIIWDNCDVGGGNEWWDWNENDNKEGDQGWNTNVYDDNNYYYAYGNMNNKRQMSNQQTWRVHGNDNQRRNNGNWKRSSGQRHESQHGHGSTFQARGSQRVRVHQ